MEVVFPENYEQRRVAAALAHRAVDLTWQRDGRKPQPILAAELVASFMAVRNAQTPPLVKVGSYTKRGKIRSRWRRVDVGFTIKRFAAKMNCHRAKAVRLLAILVELELIYKAGNYSVGRKGNVYKEVAEGQSPPQPSASTKPPAGPAGSPVPAIAVAAPVPDDDADDPWR